MIAGTFFSTGRRVSGGGFCNLALALLLATQCLPASCCDHAASCERLRGWRLSRWRETVNASLPPAAWKRWPLVTCRDQCASRDGGRTFSCRNDSERTKAVNTGLLFVISGGLCVHPSKGNLTMIITMHNIARIQTLHPSARIVLMMAMMSEPKAQVPRWCWNTVRRALPMMHPGSIRPEAPPMLRPSSFASYSFL